MSLVGSPEVFLDTCNGVLQEVPECFDNGRTRVQLSAIHISKNFIAVGSECGALFLYNRNLDRTVKPLRTDECDPVTTLELFANHESNYLAVGRKSGRIFIMCLPSEKIRRIVQSIQEDIHRGQAITCVRWSPDGRRLYSTDVCGQVIGMDVDFNNEMYTPIYISDLSEPIRDLSCTTNKIIFSTATCWRLFEAKTIKELRAHKIESDSRQVIGVSFFESLAIVVYSDGCIESIEQDVVLYRYSDEAVLEKRNFSGKAFVDGVTMDLATKCFVMNSEDFHGAHFEQKIRTCYLWSSEKLLVWDLDSGVSRCFDLIQMLNDDLLEVISVAVDDAGQVFCLTRSKSIIRVASTQVNRELITAKVEKPAPSYSFMSSVMSAAQSSSSLFSRLPAMKDLDRLRQNPKISELQSRLTEAVGQMAAKSETGTRIASELLEQFKNSPLVADFDSTALKASKPSNGDINLVNSTKKEALDLHEPEMFLPSPTDEDRELVVTRRKKTKLPGKTQHFYGVEGPEVVKVSTEEFLKKAGSSTSKVFDPAVAVDDTVEERLKAFLNGEVPPEIEKDEKEDVLPEPELTPAAEDTSLLELPTSDDPACQTMLEEEEPELPVDDVEFQENVDEPSEFTLEDAVADSIKEAEQENEDNELVEYEAIEEPSIPVLPLPQDFAPPEYSLISVVINHRTDTWNTFTLPFAAASFDVSCSYIVIVPQKHWYYYPNYRILDVIQNGLRGGGWTDLKVKASQLAVNDQGNLLWRVHRSIAYAPNDVDEASPVCSLWHEQAAHDKVLQVCLTTKHAWYLTANDVCVQMNLPEMGILHHTDCPFRLSSITASDHAVWGLQASGSGSIVARTGIDPLICPMGSDWVEDSLGGPKRFVSVALHDKTGFGIDTQGNLWFINGVDEKNPLGSGSWFQVCAPAVLASPSMKKAAVAQWQLKVSSLGVFFSVGRHLVASMQPLAGHLMRQVVPERLQLHDRFSVISASGPNRGVFVCHPDSDVFAFDLNTHNLSSICLPDPSVSVKALASTPQRLYVLDSTGFLFVRRGFNIELTPLGTTWERLDTGRLSASILNVAACVHSLWVITADCQIFMAVDGLRHGTSPVWNRVDTPVGERVDQVRVSPTGKYVWVFSTASGRAFARSQVDESSSYRGRNWVDAPMDVRISELAVGENAVWCLSYEEGRLHRLRNLSITNPVGLGWRPLPFLLRQLSVDFSESRLWAIDRDHRLVRHEMDIYPRKCLVTSKIAKSVTDVRHRSSSSDNSWIDVAGHGYSVFR